MRLNPETGLNPVSENSFNEDDSDDEDDDDEIDVENDFRVILIFYWAREKLGFNPVLYLSSLNIMAAILNKEQ